MNHNYVAKVELLKMQLDIEHIRQISTDTNHLFPDDLEELYSKNKKLLSILYLLNNLDIKKYTVKQHFIDCVKTNEKLLLKIKLDLYKYIDEKKLICSSIFNVKEQCRGE